MSEIKYWEPVGSAWRRMVEVLFRPFDLGKWMVMGFAAWFAGLNAGGGSYSSSNFGDRFNGCDAGSFNETLRYIWIEYGTLILTVGSGLLLFGLVFGLLMSWVGARGKFIFLDNVIHNRAAIVEPWKKYRMQGNSLFLWNLALGCIALVLLLLILAICFPMAWPMVTTHSNIALGIAGISLGLLLLLIYALFFSYLGVFVYDFILPIMLQHQIGIRAAWVRFLSILKPNFGKFILYGLIRYLLSIGIGMAMMAAFLLSCCCLLFVSAIPYIGTVLLLPVFVFYRFIGIEFIRSFGAEFDMAPGPESPESLQLTDPAL
jgi:hypothetical protein